MTARNEPATTLRLFCLAHIVVVVVVRLTEGGRCRWLRLRPSKRKSLTCALVISQRSQGLESLRGIQSYPTCSLANPLHIIRFENKKRTFHPSLRPRRSFRRPEWLHSRSLDAWCGAHDRPSIRRQVSPLPVGVIYTNVRVHKVT